MIPYYNENCFETPIRTSRAKQLLKALASLRKKYKPILHSTLAQLPGGNDLATNHGHQQLEAWFESKGTMDDTVLEILTPQDSNDVIIIVQLRSIDNLNTAFGKRHHGKGIGYLATFVFSSRNDISQAVSNFHAILGRALKTAFKVKKPPQLCSISSVNKTFNALKKKKHTTEPIPDTLIPSLTLLKESDFRSIVARAKQAKDPTLQNIITSAGISEAKAGPLFQQAVDEKILIRQYNVTCPQCSAPLARVPTKTAIAQMAKDNVACPKCRTCISATSYQDCFVVADHIANILDGSKWLDLFVRHKLKPYPQFSRVLTEIVDGPNELDLVVNLDGDLLLAELKDARFSIGHAYSFVGKCSQYKPDITLIIATQGVAADVKEYIKNTGLQTHYIESLESLEESFETIFSEANTRTMSKLIGEIAWTPLVTRALLSALGTSLPIPEDPFGMGFSKRTPFPGGRGRW